jgi:hypothetical protein
VRLSAVLSEQPQLPVLAHCLSIGVSMLCFKSEGPFRQLDLSNYQARHEKLTYLTEDY